MKIAIISDTHMSYPNDIMVREFDSTLQYMDAVFHLGDYTSEDVYLYLNSLSKFYGVCGNMDYGYWTQNIPHQLEISFKDIKFGFLHGYDLDFSNIERDITSRFSKDVNFFFFGHTHRRFFKRIYKTKYILNPGSFTYSKGESKGYAVVEFSNIKDVKLKWIDL